MRKLLLIIPLVLGGCAHRTTVAHSQIPAVSTMHRQVVNAVDAGEGDTVTRELRRKLALNPEDIKVRMDLAARYESQGYPDLAIEHLRFAADRAPHLSGVSMKLAKALYAAGAERDAIQTLVSFCKRDANPPVELISLLGIYEDNLGDYVQAEMHHRSAVATAPKLDLLHNNLGYNLLLQERPAEAVTEFRAAIALNPRSEIARNNLATAIAKSPGGDVKEALSQWQSISDPATAHNNLAAVYIEQKKYAEAREELRIALSFSRNHQAALSNLALLSELDGKPISINLPPSATRWQRFSSVLKRAFTGTANSKTRTESGVGSESLEAAAK